MSSLDGPGVTVDRPVRRSRLADLGERLSRTFGAQRVANWESEGDLAELVSADTDEWDPLQLRFPIVRHGYDCAAVDEYLSVLEREATELRAGTAAKSAINEELSRVGEQTSAILRLAYEQAHEITRRARADADECIAQAAARAVAMTQEAKDNLRVLDGETDLVWRERSRLIEDVRGTATALFALAEDAAERFPPEQERTEPAAAPGPAAPLMAQDGADPVVPLADGPPFFGQGQVAPDDGQVPGSHCG